MGWTDWLPGRRSATPAELPKLPGGAPVGDIFAKAAGRTASDPLEVEANATRTLVNALRSADSGYLGSLNAIITGALVRDARLAGVARTRTLAIASRRWAVRPPIGYETDREAVSVAQSMAQVFYETPAFGKRRAELAQGILRPVAVLEQDWQIDRRGWRVSRPRLIEAERVDCDVSTSQWLIADTGPHYRRPLSDWPDKFIIHSPANGLALPLQKRGALRPLIGLSLAKRFTLRWWLEMLERFGQPQVYAKAPEHASSTLLDDLAEGLRSLSSQWSASFKGDISIEALPVSINDAAHMKFCDFVNTEYAVNLLGGNLTTEVKDGQVFGSQAQDRVRGDVLAADLMELDETITDQWIEPTVRFNRPGAPVPVIETVASQQRPWQLTEYQAGLCTLDEYRTSNGADALADGRGAAFASPQLPTYAQGTQVLSIPHPLSLPSGGADAGAPFQTSPSRTSPTSPTRASGPARLLSQS